jgi:hypothetical protein
MSQLGQNRKSLLARVASALPPITDIARQCFPFWQA